MKGPYHNLKKRLLFIGVFLALPLFLVGASAHTVELESGIPGVSAGGAQGATIPDLPTYINYLYIFVLGFVGIAGFISLVVWGTVWIASAVIDKKALALEKIKSTLTGIAIALTAFIMLYTINPDLTVIRVPTIDKITVPTIKTTPLGKPLGAKCSYPSECASRYCGGNSELCEANPNADVVGMGPRTVPDGKSCYNSPQCSSPGSACQGAAGNNPGKCEEVATACTGLGYGYPDGCGLINSKCKWCAHTIGHRCVPTSVACN